MRHRSIIGLGLAKKLRALLGEDNLPVTLTTDGSGLQLSARRCSRFTYDCDGKRTSYLSGGLVVEVAAPPPAYGPWRRCIFTRSLGVNWTDDQFINAVDTLVGKALAARLLNQVRDVLYHEVESQPLTEEFARLVDEEAARSGRPACYSEMSVADVEAWRAWLAKARERADAR